jgi:hypothetical protein
MDEEEIKAEIRKTEEIIAKNLLQGGKRSK